MDEHIIYYWDKILEEDKVQEPKTNDYIIHFVLLNQYDNS